MTPQKACVGSKLLPEGSFFQVGPLGGSHPKSERLKHPLTCWAPCLGTKKKKKNVGYLHVFTFPEEQLRSCQVV